MELKLLKGAIPLALLCTNTFFVNAALARESYEPPTNPYLAAPVYGITHFNSAQNDTIPYAVKRGTFKVDIEKLPRVPSGPINIQSMAAAQKGFMWFASTNRVSYVDIRNGAWKALATLEIPGTRPVSTDALNRLLAPQYTSEAQVETLAKEILGPAPQAVTFSGLYVVVDKDNTLFVNGGTSVYAFGLKNKNDPTSGIEVKQSFDASKYMKPLSIMGSPPMNRIMAVSMTYDGNIIIGGQNSIMVIDRQFKNKPVIHDLEEGQLLKDSISVDSENGIYIATSNLKNRGDGIMQRLVWTGSALSNKERDGAWSSPYEGGDWPPSVKGGTGTGSTPTIMGYDKNQDELVVITDGNNRYKMVAFWRKEIPKDWKQIPGTKSRRIAGQIQLSAGQPDNVEWVQSEQSVVVNGWGAFVVNNMIPKGHPDKMVEVLANGPVSAPPVGMERVEWDPVNHLFKKVWVRGDVASTSMVPVASAPSGIVFVNGYSKKDGWEVTGLDWNTGKVVHRTIFGQSNLGNGAYAIMQFAENGDMIFNSVGGPVLVPLSKMESEKQ